MDEPLTWENIRPNARKTIMRGATIALLIACIDALAIISSGHIILEELDGSVYFSWMIALFFLFVATSVSIAGKLSNYYGRKKLLYFGVILLLISSVALGMIQHSLDLFLIFRAIEGFGTGILIAVSTAMVDDFYTPKRRWGAQRTVSMTIIMGLLFGVIVGGLIAEHVDWHWIFIINIPILIISMIMMRGKFPQVQHAGEKSKIDYAGIFVATFIILDILMLVQWLGMNPQWLAVRPLVMITIAVILMMLFIKIEHKAENPLITLEVFKDRSLLVCMIYMFVYSMMLVGSIVCITLFAEYVHGHGPLNAAVFNIFTIIGILLIGFVSRKLRYVVSPKIWLAVGPIVVAIALLMLSTSKYTDDHVMLSLLLFIMGCGFGCFHFAASRVVNQHARPNIRAAVNTTMYLAYTMGLVFGVAVSQLLISSQISNELYNCAWDIYELIPHDMSVMDIVLTPEFYEMFGWHGVNEILSAFVNCVDYTMRCSAIVAIFVPFTLLLLKKVKVRKQIFTLEGMQNEEGKKDEQG